MFYGGSFLEDNLKYRRLVGEDRTSSSKTSFKTLIPPSLLLPPLLLPLLPLLRSCRRATRGRFFLSREASARPRRHHRYNHHHHQLHRRHGHLTVNESTRKLGGQFRIHIGERSWYESRYIFTEREKDPTWQPARAMAEVVMAVAAAVVVAVLVAMAVDVAGAMTRVDAVETVAGGGGGGRVPAN